MCLEAYMQNLLPLEDITGTDTWRRGGGGGGGWCFTGKFVGVWETGNDASCGQCSPEGWQE